MCNVGVLSDIIDFIDIVEIKRNYYCYYCCKLLEKMFLFMLLYIVKNLVHCSKLYHNLRLSLTSTLLKIISINVVVQVLLVVTFHDDVVL